jgi:hypothetical protein
MSSRVWEAAVEGRWKTLGRAALKTQRRHAHRIGGTSSAIKGSSVTYDTKSGTSISRIAEYIQKKKEFRACI